MIIQENKGRFTYTYSDRYLFIEREDGVRFVSAYDVEPHTYTETTERVYSDEDIEQIERFDREEASRIREAYGTTE